MITIIVDDADKHVLSLYNWNIGKNGNTYYASALINGKRVYLHRYLLDAPEDKLVDHWDGNGLNNRRKNLRVATQAENLHNSHNRKRMKGVSIKREMFSARFRHPAFGTVTYLGVYVTEIEAAQSYDKYVRANYPEYEWLCNYKTE